MISGRGDPAEILGTTLHQMHFCTVVIKNSGYDLMFQMVPERKIYEAVIAWINFIPLKRKHHLPGLLRLVNLEQIPLDYLKVTCSLDLTLEYN